MIALGGFAFLLFCVFGGYLLAGGNLGVVFAALPFEMLIIGGAGAGSFVMANSMHVLKETLGGLKAVGRGARFKKRDYLDLLGLLYALVRLVAVKGAIALEAHVENPRESPIFQRYPRILQDRRIVSMVCDLIVLIMLVTTTFYKNLKTLPAHFGKEMERAIAK